MYVLQISVSQSVSQPASQPSANSESLAQDREIADAAAQCITDAVNAASELIDHLEHRVYFDTLEAQHWTHLSSIAKWHSTSGSKFDFSLMKCTRPSLKAGINLHLDE